MGTKKKIKNVGRFKESQGVRKPKKKRKKSSINISKRKPIDNPMIYWCKPIMYNEGEKKKWCVFSELKKKQGWQPNYIFQLTKEKGKGEKRGFGFRGGGCGDAICKKKKEERKFCINYQHQN